MRQSNQILGGQEGRLGYFNPWTGKYDSPVNYRLSAKEIVAESCRIATKKLLLRIDIYGDDYMEDIVSSAYSYAIRTIHRWNTDYPLYNHCWQAVHSVYPGILRRRFRHKCIPLESYENYYKYYV